MRQTRLLMDMPITVDVIDAGVSQKDIEKIYDYFIYIDNTFSPFKKSSELTRINAGKLEMSSVSNDMKEIFTRSEQTKKETNHN